LPGFERAISPREVLEARIYQLRLEDDSSARVGALHAVARCCSTRTGGRGTTTSMSRTFSCTSHARRHGRARPRRDRVEFSKPDAMCSGRTSRACCASRAMVICSRRSSHGDSCSSLRQQLARVPPSSGDAFINTDRAIGHPLHREFLARAARIGR
jgi:hypothetical protein